MELRHLRYFVAVAEEGSFTRAAERLWIAQPGLSQQIIALERELDVQLFERQSRGVDLTDAGRMFLTKARIALRAADEARLAGRDAAAGMTGRLRVGLSWQTRSDRAPELQRSFALSRPGVEVTTIEAQTDTLVADLIDRRLDAVIVLGPQDHQAGIESMTLSRTPAGVMMGRGHPLAGQRLLRDADLRGAVFMVSGDRGAVTDDQFVRRALASRDIEHSVLRGGYGFAMLAPVREGKAVMFEALSAPARGGDLVTRPMETPPTFQFDLAWLAGPRSGPLEAFIECCRGATPKRPRALAAAESAASVYADAA
jgi:DNA-binding transcriptional LysR family regulator